MHAFDSDSDGKYEKNMLLSESSTISPGDEIEGAFVSKKLGDLNRPLCTICQDRSSGFHYGTHACEGCKGFFRRMVTNVILVQSMLQCTGTVKNNCEINSVTRNNCQRCRLQKCFFMGMTRHKTRLGRRTKASAAKIEYRVNSRDMVTVLNDEEMSRYIKRESRYFNNNDTEDDEPSGKCIKHKAKLYSEKNSKCYQTYLKRSSNESSIFSCQKENKSFTVREHASEVSSSKTIINEDTIMKGHLSKLSGKRFNEIKCVGDAKDYFGISDFDVGELTTMDFTQSFLSSMSPTSNVTISSSSTSDGSFTDNKQFTKRSYSNLLGNPLNYCKRSPMFESIRINTEKLQVDELCVKIRIFLAYDFDNEDSTRLINYKSLISALNRHFFNPSIEEVEKFCRIKLHSIKWANNPQLVFGELKTEMIEMCKNIYDFFRRLPDLEIFQKLTVETGTIRKRIVQTLAIWMIKFVNVPENILYDPKLSMKIPFSLLTQSPFRHFFETLLHLADIANSILTSEIDDTELSFMSLLIITFPKKGFIHCSESMLQTDNFLKFRFLYSALLYEYMLTEKCQQNVDNTDSRFQKFCWLINQSNLLREKDVNFMFSYLKL